MTCLTELDGTIAQSKKPLYASGEADALEKDFYPTEALAVTKKITGFFWKILKFKFILNISRPTLVQSEKQFLKAMRDEDFKLLLERIQNNGKIADLGHVMNETGWSKSKVCTLIFKNIFKGNYHQKRVKI